MTYLESLSFFDVCRLFFYVFGFSMVVRYGFRYADWTLEVYKDLFVHRKKDRF